jgi:beta-1,2-mannobiose phosphorylase / 1,2-beta-oligomannan phosphorylase
MERLARSPGRLQRLGVVMEPQMHDPREAGGVLNPAVVRGPAGQLYLLPRLVAAGNYPRIGLSHVVIDRWGNPGNPVGVERLGVVLEPEASYERNPHNGGVEDPRIMALGAGRLYIMTYTALLANSWSFLSLLLAPSKGNLMFQPYP